MALITGSPGNDSLIGTNNADIISALGGDDTISSRGGLDVVDGGAGHDRLTIADLGDWTADISGGAGTATIIDTVITNQVSFTGIEELIFGSGDDSVSLTSGAMDIDLGAGDDHIVFAAATASGVINGGAGADLFEFNVGGPVNASFELRADSSDTLKFNTASNLSIDLSAVAQQSVAAGELQLTLVGALAHVVTGGGADTVIGTSADERMEAGAGADSLTGGGGDDVFAANAADFAGDQIVDFGYGDRIVVLDGAPDLAATLVGDQLTIFATGLSGTGYSMTLASPPSDARLVVDALTSTITIEVAPAPPAPPRPPQIEFTGTLDDDQIAGNSTDNLINAFDGADTAFGWAGQDTIDGGAGDDFLHGNKGQDVLRGGAGADTLLGGQDDDNLDGGDDADILFGDLGQDSLRGGQGDDFLHGNAGEDWVSGEAGADTLLGGQDADRLLGGAGNDLLSGDRGDDTLSGGSETDIFFFQRSDGGRDVITDFSIAEHDVIRLQGFANFAELSGRIAADGADAVITLDGGASIHLTGVTAAQLTAGSFLFG